MSGDAQRVIRAAAIPRLDANGLGVHLAWSGPDLIPLATGGYEVRRRAHQGEKQTITCASFDSTRLATLAQVGILFDELGLIRAGDYTPPPTAIPPDQAAAEPDPLSAGGGAAVTYAGAPIAVGEEAALDPPTAVTPDAGPADLGDATALGRRAGRVIGAAAAAQTHLSSTSPSSNRLRVYTQELSAPSDAVSVRVDAAFALAIAISGGKAVGASLVGAGMSFSAARIDTVAVYALSLTYLQICAQYPLPERDIDAEWSTADVLASGLTLPLHEADPTLAAADELATARSRLLASESLSDEEWSNLAVALRPAAASTLSTRPCDIVILDRADAEDPYQETLFEARLALLCLDPRWRRVLGFGFADTKATQGTAYDYLVSGDFAMADATDEVYDVHTVPSGTALPTTFQIRDVTFRFGGPRNVVLDPAPPANATNAVSRRGIPITTGDPVDGFVPWWTPGYSCVIDLPAPVDSVTLEVPASHNLSCAGAKSTDVIGPPGDPVPAGPLAVLTFPLPVNQLRLTGSGTLYALRLPPGTTGTTRLHQELDDIPFAAQPLPVPPMSITATNLQTPPAALTGHIDESTEVPARPQPGFRVTWVPGAVGGLGIWPPDLYADPPVDALAFVIEHRRVYPGGGVDPWEAIQSGDNLTFGSWPSTGAAPTLEFGADLDLVFPIRRPREPGSALVLAVTDVLSETATTDDPPRAPAPLGSYHQYRIVAMDVVGRVSGVWTESNIPRLEKRIPPPPPTGPQPAPTMVGNPPRLSAPPGVRARSLLASDPDLSADDATLLAGHGSAIAVDWGWRQVERDQDPSTVEFRVYVQTRVPTQVPGVITGVTSATNQWIASFTTDRWLTADECAGQWLSAGPVTLQIASHTGGSTPSITLTADPLNPATAPGHGPAYFGRPLAADHQRPASWTARVGVVGLTAADTYRYVVYDVLTPDVGHKSLTAWVGVSAADAEPYVDDELSTAVPNGGRPGNESSIAAVSVTARYRGRPVFSMPPPLGDVPEAVTDEPTGRQVVAALDAATLLTGAVSASDLVAVDRCAADAILAVTSLSTGGDVRMRRADGTQQTVTFPNSGDEQAVRDGLSSNHPEQLATRYLLYLLGRFDRPDELLERTGGFLQAAGGIRESVAAQAGSLLLPGAPGRRLRRGQRGRRDPADGRPGAVHRRHADTAQGRGERGGRHPVGPGRARPRPRAGLGRRVRPRRSHHPAAPRPAVGPVAPPAQPARPVPRGRAASAVGRRHDGEPDGGRRERIGCASRRGWPTGRPGGCAVGRGGRRGGAAPGAVVVLRGLAGWRHLAPVRADHGLGRGVGMSPLSGPVIPTFVNTALSGPLAVPDLPATPTVPVAAHPRFASDLVQWVQTLPGAQVRAAFTGSRVVYGSLAPGVPGDSTAAAALIQITPLPGDNSSLLGRLLGGTPVQYVWIAQADLSVVPNPGDEVAVIAGDLLVTVSSPGWVGFVRQDRIWRDARAWVDELETAAAGAVDGTWAPWRDKVRQLVPPNIKLLDHVGRPADGFSFTITDAAGDHAVVATAASHGDTGIAVGVAGATIVAQGGAAADPAVVVASGTTDEGAVGSSLALTPVDRHVMALRLDRWLAPRSAGVTGLHRWSTGNNIEPILDGSPYFARLVPDLRAAKNGGSVGLAGWAFVKDGLLDPSKPWSLLPEDNSTEVLPLLDELINGGAGVRILANQFLQISDADLQTLQDDAAVALTLAIMLLMPASAFGAVQFDPIGWVPVLAGPAVVAMLPNSVFRDLLTSILELSKPTVDAVNSAHPGTAFMTPYPAALADNPLADNPLHVAGIPISVLKNIGVYHQKIALAQPPAADPVAYVGGIDINSDRVDNPTHRAFAPFHDVQVRLTGPAVKDVVSTFAERAVTVGATSPLTAPAGEYADTGRHVVQVGRTYFQPSTATGHGTAFPSAPQGEATTHDTIVAAIAAAQDYIYIEDQYFTPDDVYVDALVAAGATARGVRALVITMPDRTDQPFGAERRGEVIAALQAAWGDRLRVGAPMRRYLNPSPNTYAGLGRLVLRQQLQVGDTEAVFGPSERVPGPPFWAFIEGELVYVENGGATGTGPIGTQDPDDPDPATQTWQRVNMSARGTLGASSQWGAKADKHDKGSPVLAVQLKGIYVHAKLMVVDDVFVSVGSSNLNRRGLEHDGEVNAFAIPQSLKRDPGNPALRLRCQLWAEHFGLPTEMGLSLLADPISAVQYFDRSWYRGTHWQPLKFTATSAPTVIGFTNGASVVSTALQLVVGTVEAAEKSTFWATVVDPTTGLDTHSDPATDRGPGL